jgi:hypothetical protein
MRTNHAARTGVANLRGVAVLAGALLIVGCSSGAPTAAPTTEPTVKPAITERPLETLDPGAALDVPVATKIFVPGLRLKLPASWFKIERDPAAFQVWLNEERYELTIDSTYKKAETVEQAIARLLKAPGLNAGETTALTVGGQAGLTFLADNAKAVRFSDSGFHTNEGGKIRVIAVPVADGTTVSMFVTTPDQSRFAELDQIALRILETLEWTGS